jgi:hypothetical protein
MQRRWIVAGLAGIAAALAAGLVVGARQSSSSEYVVHVRDAWVPFAATYRGVDPRGATSEGHFWRASNGSSRLEVGRGPMTYVQIVNVPRALFWRCVGAACAEGRWTEQRMVLPPEGYRPGRLQPRGARETRIGPWRVVEARSGRGAVAFEAPELDYFPIRTVWSDGGETAFDDIVPGEPDPALFELPPGATVKRLPQPGGIVFVPSAPPGAGH